MSSIPMVVQTFAGLEGVLADELRGLGLENIKNQSRAVTCNGSKKDLYSINLCARTALRVLIPIAVFKAETEEELYNGVKKIEWDKFFGIQETFVIDVSVYSSNLKHSQYVGQKSKDAIADYFMEKFGERPSVDRKKADIYIHIRLSLNECTVSMDSSGEPLYKRGYRTEQGMAPLNEILAAGMLLLSGWNKKTTLLDPMCGSGTILIEAALMAKNMPSGFLRKDFAFMHWKQFLSFDNFMWNQLKDEKFTRKTNRLNTVIAGSDISYDAVKIARENIANAKLSHELDVTQLPFDQSLPHSGECMLIFNPPYGERITGAQDKMPAEPTPELTQEQADEKLNTLYKEMGDRLKKKYKGNVAWILTSNEEAAKHIGLRPSRKIRLFNGPLACVFMKFDLFEGNRKDNIKSKTKDVPETY